MRSMWIDAILVAMAGLATAAGLNVSQQEVQMRPIEVFGRVAWTDGGFLVQEVEVTVLNAEGEVVKQEKFWELVRKLSDAETIRLKPQEASNGFLVKDLSVPGAKMRK